MNSILVPEFRVHDVKCGFRNALKIVQALFRGKWCTNVQVPGLFRNAYDGSGKECCVAQRTCIECVVQLSA